MKDYLAKIEIMINKKDYTVDGLKMIELSGDYTLISFQNKELNAEIPADIFRID
jgi:outer membrane lipoprotein-sorting protein